MSDVRIGLIGYGEVGRAFTAGLKDQAAWTGAWDLKFSDPALRAAVTPDWQIGCKRILISNAWYPMLAQDQTDLVTDGIAEIRENAIVTKDGTVREVDAIVVATGF